MTAEGGSAPSGTGSEAASDVASSRGPGGRRSEPVASGGRRSIAAAPTPSGRSVTDLELTFAQNPESDAYVELCYAYLAKRRFMEAMVVCKKAARTQTEALLPKLMLARVHEAQERYPRALEVLKGLARQFPHEPEVDLALGRVQLAAGEEAAGIEALRKALDREPALDEATELLQSKGITYPEPPPAPVHSQDLELPSGVPVVGLAPPAPGTDPGHGAPQPYAQLSNLRGVSGVHVPPGASGVVLPPGVSGAVFPPGVSGAVLPPGVSGAVLPPGVSGAVLPPGVSGGVLPPGMSGVLGPQVSGVFRIPPVRLEGEDELERMAEENARAEPSRGTPRTTFILLLALLIVSVGVVGFRFFEKSRLEAIDRLTREGLEAFDRDLYASYKIAAARFEAILQRYDEDHPATLARLAHTYAILSTEHLEPSAETRLPALLNQAEAVAGDNPHTRAARGLVDLGRGPDAAAGVIEELIPHAARDQTAVPTFVDLTLGIAERSTGELEEAHRRLQRVADFQSRNVRARVWSARASESAGRLATAQRSYLQVRKAEPRHPGALAGLALVTLARGDLEAAKTALDGFDALETSGSRDISPKDRALAQFAKSELLRQAGQGVAADVAYERATELDPGNPEFPFGRGRGLLARDKLDAAVRFLGEAVAMEPTRWTYRIELAEALMRARKFEEARQHLDFALERAPGELSVALAQARFLRRTSSAETETYLTETLPAKFPDASVELALERGRYYRAQGDLTKAEAELAGAVESFNGRSQALQGNVLVSFGLVAWDSSRRDEAVKAYRAAARRGNLDALALLANALQNGNAEERREAKEAAQRYLGAGDSLRRTDFVRAIADRLR